MVQETLLKENTETQSIELANAQSACKRTPGSNFKINTSQHVTTFDQWNSIGESKDRTQYNDSSSTTSHVSYCRWRQRNICSV